MPERIIGAINPKQGQTWLQLAAIVVGSAVLFQIGVVAATADANVIVADPKGWIISAGIGIIQVAGVSILALKTAGGIKFS